MRKRWLNSKKGYIEVPSYAKVYKHLPDILNMARLGDAARNIQDFVRGFVYFGIISLVIAFFVGFIISVLFGSTVGTVSFFAIFVLVLFVLFKYAYSRG